MLRTNINRFKLVLSLIQIYLAVFKEFVWLNFMPSPGNELVKKFNFISPLVFGNGNIFPLIFFIGLVLSSILLVIKLIKGNGEIYKKPISVLETIEFIALIFPLIIGMQKINLGIFFMIFFELIQVLINRLIRG